MAIDKLAPEIWLQIADCDLWFRALGALARVNRKLHDIFNPMLYRLAVDELLFKITVIPAAKGNLATLKRAAAFGADMSKVPELPSLKWVDRQLKEWDLCLESLGFLPDVTCWGTPLHAAAKNGHYYVVEWLLTQGVDIEAPARIYCECRPVASWNPLESPLEYIDHLKESPAWTPLHHAICSHHASIARLLLSAGARHDHLYVSRGSYKFPDFDYSDLTSEQIDRVDHNRLPHQVAYRLHISGPDWTIDTWRLAWHNIYGDEGVSEHRFRDIDSNHWQLGSFVPVNSHEHSRPV